MLLFVFSGCLQVVAKLFFLTTQSAHALAGALLREIDYPMVPAGFF